MLLRLVVIFWLAFALTLGVLFDVMERRIRRPGERLKAWLCAFAWPAFGLLLVVAILEELFHVATGRRYDVGWNGWPIRPGGTSRSRGSGVRRV